MSDRPKKTEMTSLSLHDLDVSELENRIELAASSANCDCRGSCAADCSRLVIGEAKTTVAPTC